jgi:SAM-dependent methyltransferase
METVACALCGSSRSRPWFTKEEWTVVQCRGCSLRYLNPRPDERERRALYTQDYFEEHGVQPQARSAGEIAKAVAAHAMRLRAAALFARPGALLEVGCASGYFLKGAAERGWQAKGIELSAWAARYARDVLGLDVFTGSLEDANLPDASFDVVCMWSVLEHLPEPLQALAEVRRVLKPGGVFVADVPNVGGRHRHLKGRGWRGWSLPHHLYHFTPSTLQALARRAQLAPIHTEFSYLSLSRMLTPGAKAHRWMTPMAPPEGSLAQWVRHTNRRVRMWLFSGRDMRIYCRKAP